LPTKISALGIDFSSADQKSLLLILSAIVAYFLIAFIVYGVSDFLAWRVSYHHAMRDVMKSRLEKQANASSNKADTITQQLDEYSQMTFPWVGVSRPVSLLRAFLDFILPVVFGVGTIVLLLMADVAKKSG